jgi:predicted Zn-ribbon and HTH transcriptional regulator
MSQTIRQIMASLLETQELSALDLASALLLTAREVEEHLAHLKSSHKGRLRMRPARCRRCGYEIGKHTLNSSHNPASRMPSSA